MNTENAEAATPEVSRSSDLSEEMNEVARRLPTPTGSQAVTAQLIVMSM